MVYRLDVKFPTVVQRAKRVTSAKKNVRAINAAMTQIRFSEHVYLNGRIKQVTISLGKSVVRVHTITLMAQ